MATCLGLAMLSGCVDGDTGVIETGPLGGNGSGGGQGSNGDTPDAGGGGGGGGGGGTDAGSGTTTPDAPAGATCPASGATDVGAPSSFQMNTPVYKSSGNYFVIRDSGGLYAVSARCTHEGATCTIQSNYIYCPRHAARFDFNGGPVSGPVFTALSHYAMCLLPNGNVGVITSQKVAKTDRLNA
jgi:nitrite reductase/ring-hydroxylating ferredoxin subunit